MELLELDIFDDDDDSWTEENQKEMDKALDIMDRYGRVRIISKNGKIQAEDPEITKKDNIIETLKHNPNAISDYHGELSFSEVRAKALNGDYDEK